MRKLSNLLIIVGLVAVAFVIYNFTAGKTITPTMMLGVLVLLLGIALHRGRSEPLEGGSTGSQLPPSQKTRGKHKSWISRQ